MSYEPSFFLNDPSLFFYGPMLEILFIFSSSSSNCDLLMNALLIDVLSQDFYYLSIQYGRPSL